MKVKNIMFSGFAAAILMGVGAANAVVANPVTLADQGYVDAKFNSLDGKKEAVANKVSAITEENRDSADLYTSVKAVTGYVKEITTGEMGQLGDLAVLNSIKNENVAEDAAIAQSKIDGLVDALADKAVKSEVTEALNAKADKSVVDGLLTGNDSVANQIANALKDAEAAAKAYADGLAANYDADGAAAQALVDAKAYTDQEVGKVEVNVTANTTAIEKLNGDANTEGSVDYKIAQAGHEAEGAAAQALADAKKYTDDEILELNLSQYATDKELSDGLAGKLNNLTTEGTYMVTRAADGTISYTQVKVATVDGEGNATVTD